MKSIKEANTGEKVTVFIIDNSIAVTGAVKSIVYMANLLAGNYRFIFVLPRNSSAVTYITQSGFECETLPFVEISRSFSNLLKYIPFLFINGYRLKKLSHKFNVEIIHTNDFYNLTSVVTYLLGANVKLVTHVRFLPQRFSPLLANFWVRTHLLFSKKIICVSNAVRHFFPSSSKVVTLYDSMHENGKYAAKESDLNKNGVINLLYLGNYIPGKGQDLALLAFEEAFKSNSHLRLRFVGGDMGLEKNIIYKTILERFVEDKKLSNVVEFHTFASDVEAEIKSADICLNFSESESFSLTCLEALYYGTPLIASDSGGPSELFENGVSGILVPNKDLGSMVKAILQLSSDLELRNKFSIEGRKYVNNKFNAEVSVKQLASIYRSL